DRGGEPATRAVPGPECRPGSRRGRREGGARSAGLPRFSRAHAVGTPRARAALLEGLRATPAEIPRGRRARPEARGDRAGPVGEVRSAPERGPGRRPPRPEPRGVPLADRGAACLALRPGAAHALSGLGQAPAEVLG